MNKKEEIISCLKKFKRLSTSRFVGLLGIDYNSLKKLLEELEEEKIIVKQEETVATYWILKEVKNG